MNDYTTWLQEARDTMNITLMELDCESLIPQMSISFNNRFTSRMGDANFRLKRVRLSAPLWPVAGKEERFQTVVHEVCHIVARYMHWPRNIKSHGWEWKDTMKRAGVPVERCHNVDRSSVKQVPRKKHRTVCDCREYMMGSVRYRRMVSGLRYYTCNYCGARFRIPKEGE